jgi:dynein heavy chain
MSAHFYCLPEQEVYERQVAQLSELIELINGDLSANDRKKLITLCTIDVHARDVVQRLIDERVDSASAFQWQSQLRYCQQEKTKECQARIMLPAKFLYVPMMGF